MSCDISGKFDEAKWDMSCYDTLIAGDQVPERLVVSAIDSV